MTQLMAAHTDARRRGGPDAGQVKVEAAMFASYDWSGRTTKNHRAQVREFHGFREPTVGDEGKLADWLADKICPVEMSRDQLRGALPRRQNRAAEDHPDRTHPERGGTTRPAA
ncbi:hypothetical protein ACFYOK_13700 [Microbispora bryophytorum]|uniref:hypothetical protein n=1 Tax=Microbispora bryophytorum TaxID=1460882 RepID=UPI0033EB5726